jgi:hypothetical protein
MWISYLAFRMRQIALKQKEYLFFAMLVRDYPCQSVKNCFFITLSIQPGLIRRNIPPMADNLMNASLLCGKNS